MRSRRVETFTKDEGSTIREHLHRLIATESK
jgi:hypothetical protein